MTQSGRRTDPSLERLAAFLPIFEKPGFVFAESGGGQEIAPGEFVWPYVSLTDAASQFVDTAYDAGWVLRDFDWPAWVETAEAQSFRDPSAVAQATHGELARLLTVLIRQDRFSEGSLAGAFDCGLLTAILRRAESLRTQQFTDSGAPPEATIADC